MLDLMRLAEPPQDEANLCPHGVAWKRFGGRSGGRGAVEGLQGGVAVRFVKSAARQLRQESNGMEKSSYRSTRVYRN